MKYPIATVGVLVLTMFIMAGCLEQGSSAKPPASRIAEPIDELILPTPTPTPVATPQPTPTPAPDLTFADLDGKVITRGSESITLGTLTMSDSLCGGGVMTVTSVTEMNNVVTVVASHTGNPSWVLPVNEDCMLTVTNPNYRLLTAGCAAALLDPRVWPEIIRYTVTRSGDDYSITRQIETRPLKRMCTYTPQQNHTYPEVGTMAAEVYND